MLLSHRITTTGSQVPTSDPSALRCISELTSNPQCPLSTQTHKKTHRHNMHMMQLPPHIYKIDLKTYTIKKCKQVFFFSHVTLAYLAGSKLVLLVQTSFLFKRNSFQMLRQQSCPGWLGQRVTVSSQPPRNGALCVVWLGWDSACHLCSLVLANQAWG